MPKARPKEKKENDPKKKKKQQQKEYHPMALKVAKHLHDSYCAGMNSFRNRKKDKNGKKASFSSTLRKSGFIHPSKLFGQVTNILHSKAKLEQKKTDGIMKLSNLMAKKQQDSKQAKPIKLKKSE